MPGPCAAPPSPAAAAATVLPNKGRMHEEMELDDFSVPENEDEWIINLKFKGYQSLTFKVEVYQRMARIHDTSRDTTDEILSMSILRTSPVMNDAIHRMTTDQHEK
jgi:hypothetical protein